METTFYLTKKALTKGIQKMIVQDTLYKKTEKTLTLFNGKYNIPISWIEKPHWHETIEEAVEQAEEMRLKEIEKTERKLKKLQETKFIYLKPL